jgi:protein SCO1/2
MTPIDRRRWLQATLGTALGAAALGSLTGCDSPTPPVAFKSVDITGADYADAFDLPDVNGQRRTVADFKGQLLVLFFGYTQCPDVCPTTLGALAEARALMGPDGDKLVTALVTLDPARDTAELLKAYLAHFDPKGVALRGSDAEIATTAKRFKVFYRKAEGATPEGYTMDHTAASYVFDTRGRIRLYQRNGMKPADMAADFQALLKQAG